MVSFIFESLNCKKHQDLWQNLRLSIRVGQTPWATIDDFNVILSSIENIGGLKPGKRCPHFSEFVDLVNLYDMGYMGSPFT